MTRQANTAATTLNNKIKNGAPLGDIYSIYITLGTTPEVTIDQTRAGTGSYGDPIVFTDNSAIERNDRGGWWVVPFNG